MSNFRQKCELAASIALIVTLAGCGGGRRGSLEGCPNGTTLLKVVVQGDTRESVAKEYGLTKERLGSITNANSLVFEPGDVVCLGESEKTNVEIPKEETPIVQTRRLHPENPLEGAKTESGVIIVGKTPSPETEIMVGEIKVLDEGAKTGADNEKPIEIFIADPKE